MFFALKIHWGEPRRAGGWLGADLQGVPGGGAAPLPGPRGGRRFGHRDLGRRARRQHPGDGASEEAEA